LPIQILVQPRRTGPTRTARTAIRLRMLAAARPVGDIRNDAALFPNYFGQTCYYSERTPLFRVPFKTVNELNHTAA